MTKYIKHIFFLGVLFALASCASQLDDQLEDPNNITPDNLDVNFLTNKVMVGFSDFYSSANDPAMELARYTAMTGGETYARAYQPQSHNTLWSDGYQGVLVQAEELLKAVNGKGLDHHEGVAKTLKAFTYMTLVDLFNDVPFAQAVSGTSGNFNPTSDKGDAIYNQCITMLDEAIVSLGKTPIQKISRDIYYGGDNKKWAALARTLKLKAYMNLSLADAGAKAKIEALLAEDIIDTDAESFTYKYGSAALPAKSRHFLYRRMYPVTAGEADGYLSNFLLINIFAGKSVEDPRWRYYVYRQVGSLEKALETNPESLPCVLSPRPDHILPNQGWCAFEPGFFGRDHGNNDGIPPDGGAITVAGVYPFGGRVDLNNGVATYEVYSKDGQGANGAGIEPIWMAYFTDFLKAEAVARLGVAGDAKALLVSGVTKSITAVQAFGAAKGQTVPAALVTPTADYVDEVSSAYDAAQDKMNVIGKEYWLALYGNGVEAYNLYRRTGKPADMQPMRAADAGNFIYSFIYPANYVNLNSSATQKDINAANKVFWDKNTFVLK
ncbi:MAG TPA: SusD/RagB family nutrient-binding outer membrane lipoprotein [Saprospiraceae bacterium]|nr:SusD/RagB family nutrient-binding outer membrane lipoprotein [Saprospiraceae bacterium]